MGWQTLLADRKVKAHTTSKQELDDLRAVIERNTVDYDRAHVASDTEATEILQETKAFLQLTEAWISQNYPQFQKA